MNAPDAIADAAGAAGAGATAAFAAPTHTGALGLAVQAHGRWLAAGAVVLALLSGAAVSLAWNTQQRVKALETELVRRQQDSTTQATEARTLARQAEEAARAAVARTALLEVRLAETTMQRTQLEELIQSLARSRDESVLVDIDAAVRVALQQTAITGSAEPLLVALRQADERLARSNQPRLERVRRAVAQDLERTRAAGSTDIALLAMRLDEAIRQIDDLPLLATPERASSARPSNIEARREAARAAAAQASAPAPAPATAASAASTLQAWRSRWLEVGSLVWQEARSLLRVTRITQPEALLVAPEQAYFLRENLKLRLLNARLALLSRQFDTVQADLRDAQSALDRYFDRSVRSVGATSELLREVAVQARQVGVPRPDATLAAIAAVAPVTAANR